MTCACGQSHERLIPCSACKVSSLQALGCEHCQWTGLLNLERLHDQREKYRDMSFTIDTQGMIYHLDQLVGSAPWSDMGEPFSLCIPDWRLVRERFPAFRATGFYMPRRTFCIFADLSIMAPEPFQSFESNLAMIRKRWNCPAAELVKTGDELQRRLGPPAGLFKPLPDQLLLRASFMPPDVAGQIGKVTELLDRASSRVETFRQHYWKGA